MELVGNQNPGSDYVSGAREGERGGSQEDVRGSANARRAIEKSRYGRVIEVKEVRGDDSIQHFFPTGIGSNFRVPKGMMAVEISQNDEISGGGKSGGRKGVVSAVRRRRAKGENKHLVRTPFAGSCFITLVISAVVVHLAIAILIAMDYLLVTK